MHNLEQDIVNFHEKFGNEYDGEPRELPTELSNFRIYFLQEELDEYIDAVRNKDLEKQFDALIDLVYVAIGTAYIQGFPFNKGWQLVHSANMKKIRATSIEQSTRASLFDVVKPEGWVAPDLKPLLGVTPNEEKMD